MDHVCWAQVVCCEHLFLNRETITSERGKTMVDYMGNGCVQVNWIHRYHAQKFIALRKVPTNYIQNLTLWCMDWDKWMHQLVTLEHNWRLIQRWGKDGSDQQFRKDLSHNGAVRWEVIERFSEWSLQQYMRWQSAAGDWYVDCGNWNYCHILDNQCGILYCTNDENIAHALQMGQKRWQT